MEQEKAEEAVGYYKQVAVDFRASNLEAAGYAIGKVVGYYIRSAPNEPKLREFYEKAQTFEESSRKTSDDNYWLRVRQYIRSNGIFQPAEKDKAAGYFAYWAKAMDGKRPADDDFQIDQADFRCSADGDVSKWMVRLDQQFATFQKEGDYARIIKWISLYHAQKNKVQEYYSKLNFAKMAVTDIQSLMVVLFDDVNDAAMAKNIFDKIALDRLNDGQKDGLARYLWTKDARLVERVCASISDKEEGKAALLSYYHWAKNGGKGIPLADEVAANPKYSKDAYWKKAELLQWQNKFPEAISAYQSADVPPRNLWRIADCYLAMGKRDQALAQLQEIENFFPDQAPEAALRTAFIWRDASDNKKYIACLRGIMKKYTKSGQSSTAHQELQRMGVKIGGGEDAE